MAAGVFLLLRLDLVAMWLFVTSSAVLLFGLRPVIRFAWVWGMLLMVFPLPYYLAVLTFGGLCRVTPPTDGTANNLKTACAG